MVTTRLFLTGITASGHHGARPGEKDEAQEFVVDLDVEVEVRADELSSTSDYRALIRAARETVEGTSFDLLETLADAVANAILERDGVVRVSVMVHKPAAARSSGVRDVAAAATVER